MATGVDPVRTAIWLHALHGRPVTIPSLAQATGRPPGEVAAALTALHEAGAVYVRDGAIIAAYPFSIPPTAHRVIIGELTVYANCAVDALAVPPMVDEAAEIASPCGRCGGPVTVAMHGDRVLGSRPAAPAVFYVGKECCAAGPAVLTRCPHIQFFCGRDHVAQWLNVHPELRGAVYDLAAAAAFASRHFSEAIRAVRESAGRRAG